jgi:hypothetical protein
MAYTRVAKLRMQRIQQRTIAASRAQHDVLNSGAFKFFRDGTAPQSIEVGIWHARESQRDISRCQHDVSSDVLRWMKPGKESRKRKQAPTNVGACFYHLASSRLRNGNQLTCPRAYQL